MADEFGYEKLEVWQLGMNLADHVYDLTKEFPKTEVFGLIPQLRRSAVSIPSNIAEGFGRGSRPAFANCAKISRGELYEVRTQIEISRRQKFITEEDNAAVRSQMITLSRKLNAFIMSLED
jgi:four helix bundle protein